MVKWMVKDAVKSAAHQLKYDEVDKVILETLVKSEPGKVFTATELMLRVRAAIPRAKDSEKKAEGINKRLYAMAKAKLVNRMEESDEQSEEDESGEEESEEEESGEEESEGEEEEPKKKRVRWTVGDKDAAAAALKKPRTSTRSSDDGAIKRRLLDTLVAFAKERNNEPFTRDDIKQLPIFACKDTNAKRFISHVLYKRNTFETVEGEMRNNKPLHRLIM